MRPTTVDTLGPYEIAAPGQDWALGCGAGTSTAGKRIKKRAPEGVLSSTRSVP